MPHQIAAHAQRLAAHPKHSAWVAASAGSGKTKVLTDRVLNLLLEGCAPERLLCLTFTKAAAAEMANRVRVRLGEWAIASEADLETSLFQLTGAPPSPEACTRARMLFSLILDAPGGLKIQTIHSFCQSLLKRFPLEAGLSPFFKVATDSEQKALLTHAFYKTMEDPIFQPLCLHFSETSFEEVNLSILQRRVEVRQGNPLALSYMLGTATMTKEALLQNLFSGLPEERLRAAIPCLLEGSPTDQERGQKLADFLNVLSLGPRWSLPSQKRGRDDKDYLSLFLTQEGAPRARLVTKKVADSHPDILELLTEEADRLEAWLERWHTLEISELSTLLLTYAQAFLETYDGLKHAQSLLDYEDLILKTAALLRNPGCHWVLYKLDGGLDHILLDEAQDTSPTQWQVIRAIGEEFYANAATSDTPRTLFIVGDGKQSIYSFQGADPTVFTQMQQDLRTFAREAQHTWQDVDLNVSFRSTPEILEVVDAVFAGRPLASSHLPFRKEAQGLVELWPLIEKQPDPVLAPWQPPLIPLDQAPPQKRLAHLIAAQVQGWLSSRPLTPGDILILVRRRTEFVDFLIQALKERQVPVAGVDRLWLLEGLGVQDLLKLGEFLLLPEDDLTLATVLKGPLFNMSEEDLFTLAHGRGQSSLWQRLTQNEKFSASTTILKDLLSHADFLTPFDLYSYILGPLGGRKTWQAHLGPEVLDFLDEFLNLCLTFQETHPPSLQGFMHWISQEVVELKRDLDQRDLVRIMTVHGSKGLQAPVVILPDTTQLPGELPPFAFHQDALVWLPPQAKDIPLTKALKQTLRHAQMEEYERLLYVALTRAQDALYVCGWGPAVPESWYTRIHEGLSTVGETFTFPPLEADGVRFGHIPHGTRGQNAASPPPFLLPQWLQTPPLPETARPLVRPSEGDDSMTGSSPFGTFGTQRGTLIHALLEFLPQVEPSRRETAATHYLTQTDVPSEWIPGMVSSVQGVLEAYPHLFGPLSVAEVPLMGYLGESLLSGQIDRLIMEEDHVLILDYKTHSAVPPTLADIPQTYLDQMALYRKAVAQIYPEKEIVCGLLWTELPRLDILPSERGDVVGVSSAKVS